MKLLFITISQFPSLNKWESYFEMAEFLLAKHYSNWHSVVLFKQLISIIWSNIEKIIWKSCSIDLSASPCLFFWQWWRAQSFVWCPSPPARPFQKILHTFVLQNVVFNFKIKLKPFFFNQVKDTARFCKNSYSFTSNTGNTK